MKNKYLRYDEATIWLENGWKRFQGFNSGDFDWNMQSGPRIRGNRVIFSLDNYLVWLKTSPYVIPPELCDLKKVRNQIIDPMIEQFTEDWQKPISNRSKRTGAVVLEQLREVIEADQSGYEGTDSRRVLPGIDYTVEYSMSNDSDKSFWVNSWNVPNSKAKRIAYLNRRLGDFPKELIDQRYRDLFDIGIRLTTRPPKAEEAYAVGETLADGINKFLTLEKKSALIKEMSEKISLESR